MFHHQGPMGPVDGPIDSQVLGSQTLAGNLQGLGGSGPMLAGGPKAGPRQPGFRRRLRNPQVTALVTGGTQLRLGHLGSNWWPSGTRHYQNLLQAMRLRQIEARNKQAADAVLQVRHFSINSQKVGF